MTSKKPQPCPGPRNPAMLTGPPPPNPSSEIEKLNKSHALLSQQCKEARQVIMLYRRWEHASDVECSTGDEADTSDMLIEASFAARDFMDKWEGKIATQEKGG